VHCHADEEGGVLDAERVLSDAGEGGGDADFFIAGPVTFTMALRERLIANRVTSKRIHYESFEYL
jgi:ferredoxin-NADP reductase